MSTRLNDSQVLTTQPIHETIITDIINKATKIESSFGSDSYYRVYFPQDNASLECLMELMAKTSFPKDQIQNMIDRLKLNKKIRDRIFKAVNILEQRL